MKNLHASPQRPTMKEHAAEKKASYTTRVSRGEIVYARRPIRLTDYRPLDDGTLDRYGQPAWGHHREPIIVPAGKALIVESEANAGDRGIVAWVREPSTGMRAEVSTGALSR